MKTRTYDAYRRCTCGHIKGLHHIGAPYACRSDDGCESFMPTGTRWGAAGRDQA